MILLVLEAAAALALLSGVPVLLSGAGSIHARAFGRVLGLLGSTTGLVASMWSLCSHNHSRQDFAWSLPGASLSLGLDPLSAFFLVPIFLIGGLGTLYQAGYWTPSIHPRNYRRHCFCWGLLQASMALVVIARHGVLFLFAWELMALSAYFLISTEDQLEEVREAGWVYLVATHVGTLSLFGMFALMKTLSGALEWHPLPTGAPEDWRLFAVFLLGLVGFGIKAGIMPLHFWLPGAHANAPSHVSAILSGVMLKMGVYGLVRTLSLFPDPPVAWGAVLFVLGAASGFLGIWLAMANQDLKRLLAYSSVENVGILLMGLGLAVIGRALGREDLQVLGMGGCLLHVWNHALFKPLLFFGAGSVLHATHSRQLDVLGGLSRRMPLTAALFLIGALSISALPPLNGFVSELLIYLGLFRASQALDGGGWAGAALGAPILAMIGALAAACFVKVSGVAFLGAPRTPRAEAARESPWAMLAPMGILAACCLAVGVLPVGVAPFLEAATECWIGETLVANGEGTLGALAPLRDIGLLSGALAIGIASVSLLLLPRMKKVVGRQMTWDCGYSSPGPRMQYSASSFARILAKPLEWVFHPTSALPRLVGLFPEKGPFKPQVSRSFPEGGLQPYLTRLVEHGRLQLNLALFVLILGILLFLGRLDP